jgi:O-antigen ligase
MATSSIVFIEPAPYDIFAIAMLGILAVTGLRFPRGLQTAVFLLGLFLAGNIVAAITSPDPLASMRSMSIRIYMVLAWLMIASVVAMDPDRMLRALFTGYAIAAVIAVCWGSLEYFGLLQSEQWQGGLRAKGAFKDPNVYGPFLVPAAIYTLRCVPRMAWAGRFLMTGLFLFLSFGILLSFSRGAWMNFALSCILFGTLAFSTASGTRERLVWLTSSIIVAGILIAVLAGAVSTEIVGERFNQRATLAQDYDVAEGGRFDTQREALGRIGRNPLGVGPGQADEALGLEPHNIYLHVFLEGGWLAGFGLLTFLLLTAVRSLPLFNWRSALRPDFFVVLACLIGTLVQSLFIDSTHWRHLWLLLALLWALIASHGKTVTAAQP